MDVNESELEPRVAMEDVEVGGTLIKKGEGVLALLFMAVSYFDQPGGLM